MTSLPKPPPLPMPSLVAVWAAVRDDQPVATVLLTDVLGETQAFDLSIPNAASLLRQLANFIDQVIQ